MTRNPVDKAFPPPEFAEPRTPCYRMIFDSMGNEVLYIASTYRENGSITPVEADILARVFNKYLHSSAFKEDWKEAARINMLPEGE